jgi:hypothetical protein
MTTTRAAVTILSTTMGMRKSRSGRSCLTERVGQLGGKGIQVSTSLPMSIRVGIAFSNQS